MKIERTDQEATLLCKVTIMSRREERRMKRRVERMIRSVLLGMGDEVDEMVRRRVASTIDSMPGVFSNVNQPPILQAVQVASPSSVAPATQPILDRTPIRRDQKTAAVTATPTTPLPTGTSSELPSIASDIVCYVCMPRLELVMDNMYIVSNSEKGHHQLKCVRNGRVDCSINLTAPVDGVIRLGHSKLAIVSTSSAGTSVTYIRLLSTDSQDENSDEVANESNQESIDEASSNLAGKTIKMVLGQSSSYVSVMSVSEGVEYSSTVSAVYRTDVDSGELRLQQIKTKLPVGRLMTVSTDSAYICTLTRLQRFSKEKMSGLPVWEHELVSTHIRLLRCSDKYVAYAHRGGITTVDILGETHTHRTDEYVTDMVVHDTDVLYMTSTGLNVLSLPTLLVRRYKLSTTTGVGIEPYMAVHEDNLYYSTSFTIQKIKLATLQ